VQAAGRWRPPGPGTADIIKRISAGESFDLIIAANSTIDDFILPGGSKSPAGSISLAALSESPCNEGRNGLTSVAEALKRVLLAAKSVGYSTGPSVVYLAALFESMGIAGDIKAKSRRVLLGATVGPIIASGEVEIGFQQMSELLHVDGIN
jgi:molybdate transport system substrate-binding protein